MVEPTAAPAYLTALWYQKGVYPAHTIKMRCVENHDQLRIMADTQPGAGAGLDRVPGVQLWPTAALRRAGSRRTHTPSLFDIHKARLGGLYGKLPCTKLCQLKKDRALMDGRFTLLTPEPAITALVAGRA